jgi:hypothetical protein
MPDLELVDACGTLDFAAEPTDDDRVFWVALFATVIGASPDEVAELADTWHELFALEADRA